MGMQDRQITNNISTQSVQTERFQQLQPNPSSTQMTPTPSPSAPDWNNITNTPANYTNTATVAPKPTS